MRKVLLVGVSWLLLAGHAGAAKRSGDQPCTAEERALRAEPHCRAFVTGKAVREWRRPARPGVIYGVTSRQGRTLPSHDETGCDDWYRYGRARLRLMFCEGARVVVRYRGPPTTLLFHFAN